MDTSHVELRVGLSLVQFFFPHLLQLILQPGADASKLDVLVGSASLLTFVNQLLLHALVAGVTRPKVKVTELDHRLVTPMCAL